MLNQIVQYHIIHASFMTAIGSLQALNIRAEVII